jgi:hypothetical protein
MSFDGSAHFLITGTTDETFHTGQIRRTINGGAGLRLRE